MRSGIEVTNSSPQADAGGRAGLRRLSSRKHVESGWRMPCRTASGKVDGNIITGSRFEVIQARQWIRPPMVAGRPGGCSGPAIAPGGLLPAAVPFRKVTGCERARSSLRGGHFILGRLPPPQASVRFVPRERLISRR
jgi:hypothetical protein